MGIREVGFPAIRKRGVEFVGGELHERLTAAAQWLQENTSVAAELYTGKSIVENHDKRIVEQVSYLGLRWCDTKPNDNE